MTVVTETSPFVDAAVRGRVGLITLQRPKALNALTLDMVRALTSHLKAWQDDAQVLAVVVRVGIFGFSTMLLWLATQI